jgi:hypothetical protein
LLAALQSLNQSERAVLLMRAMVSFHSLFFLCCFFAARLLRVCS